ncbi:MAG: hypothetical protein IIY94_01285 [Oscillospiraceae bacterium]|nr:hypothetical protein [Oscillospiraceae bacterium]
MKSEDIYNAVTELRDDSVRAGERKLRRSKPSFMRRFGALAAVLAVVIIAGVVARPWLSSTLGGQTEQMGIASAEPNGAQLAHMDYEPVATNLEPTEEEPNGTGAANPNVVPTGLADWNAFSLARAAYPKMAPYPLNDPWHENQEAWDAWWEDYCALHPSDADYDRGMDDYLRASVPMLLSGTGEDNCVASPLNIYMALAMLAETTAGESREELLTLLNVPDLETLREQSKALWEANYCDDGRLTELLATSLWLRDGMDYNDETVQRLAEDYYASVYAGPMGDEAYNETLRDWMNEQTGHLLEDQIRDIGMSGDTVAALVSTLYYKASWGGGFSRVEEALPFHGPNGDTNPVFMRCVTEDSELYTGEGFQAAGTKLDGGGKMFFLLPDEGLQPEALLKNANALEFLLSDSGRSSADSRQVELTLTVPEFDVSAKLDLIRILQELGVHAIFEEDRADFSPLTTDNENPITVSEAQHGARIVVDEDGVLGAAYTIIEMSEAACEPEEPERASLTLDRPFLFVVTNNEGLPIFVGIIHDPSA